MINFNSSLRGSKAYMKAFSVAKSTQLNHYVRPKLDEFQHDLQNTYRESMAFHDQRVKMKFSIT